MMSYRHLSIATGVLSLSLCAALIAVPELIYWILGITGNESATFMSRRAAMLFLGLAYITFQSRNEPHSELRAVLCLGCCATFATLAILGAWEFARGNAGPGIGLPIATELLVAASYFAIWRASPNEATRAE